MDREEEVLRLLKDHGAVLSRTKKHNVWKFPDGKMFIMSQSPSDWRTSMEQLQDLKRILGLTKAEATTGSRRKKKNKPGRFEMKKTTTVMAEVLAPLVEEGEVARLKKQISHLETRLAARRREIRYLKAFWPWRFRHWLKGIPFRIAGALKIKYRSGGGKS